MKIGNNRKSFYQWELNQFIVDEDFKIDDEVNFSSIKTREALVVKVKDKNNTLIAEVPNILLQDYHPIYVYWIVLNETGEYVQKEAKFEVIKRPRPQDYVYTETEIWSYSELEQRVKILEKSGTSPEAIGQAVEEYLKENPVEVDLTGVVKSVNGEAPDENGNVEITIPEGSSGGISILGTAEVGQTIKVSAVDENGKPTEWEAVNFPGVNKKLRKVADISIDQAEMPVGVEITQDMDGNPLALKEFIVWTDVSSSVSYCMVYFNGYQSGVRVKNSGSMTYYKCFKEFVVAHGDILNPGIAISNSFYPQGMAIYLTDGIITSIKYGYSNIQITKGTYFRVFEVIDE